MPQVTVEAGVQLHYTEHGEGEETVVFSHSYLVDHRHFEPQLEALKSRYRVLAYDHRGHGKSDKPPDGYSMERIYADGVALLEAEEGRRRQRAARGAGLDGHPRQRAGSPGCQTAQG